MIHAGDLIAFQTKGDCASLIKFGQRYLGHSPDWRYTHIAVAVTDGDDPDIVQAVRHVDRVKLSSYGDTPYKVISFPGVSAQRKYVVQFTTEQVGSDYGVLAVVLKGINMATPDFIRITGERKGHMFCSVLGARAWEHGGYSFPPYVDIWLLSPSDLVDQRYLKEKPKW